MFKKWMLGMVLLSTSSFIQATPVINGSATSGADMAGMGVTVCYDDVANTCETTQWDASLVLPTAGGAGTSNWGLELEGDSAWAGNTTGFWDGRWELQNNNITAGINFVEIDAGVANILFDIYADLFLPSTPGSGAGFEFIAAYNFTPPTPTATTRIADDITATFSDQFGSYGDLFGKIQLVWDNGSSLQSNESLTFFVDTDIAVDVNITPVPEPSTMFTFALGLIALISLRKKSSGKSL